jgi:hypothetical protein
MSSKANKPGGSAYDNEATMAYCLIEILGISTTLLDTGSHEIIRALIKSRISKFYDEFAVLGTDDIMNLPVPAYGGYNAVAGVDAPTILPHGNKKIGLLHVQYPNTQVQHIRVENTLSISLLPDGIEVTAYTKWHTA